jgi:D-lactate dehydrogenase
MNITFFEWSEAEESIFKRLPNDSLSSGNVFSFESKPFSLDLLRSDTNIISIFVDSRLSDEDLQKLVDFGVKKILLRSAGYNMLNVEKAKEIGISVSRVASYSPESIAEHVFALTLSLTRKVMVDRRKHTSNTDGRDISQMGITLRGKTLGLYGFGQIGQIVAKIASGGFDMNVKYFDPHTDLHSDKYHKVETLEELFESSDVISIHVPLIPPTAGSVNKSLLTHAKGAYLINTSRGNIVNTEDCLEALDNGSLSGLGFDVAGDNDSYSLLPVRDNIVFTQHTAFFTDDAVKSILLQTFESITTPNEKNILC